MRPGGVPEENPLAAAALAYARLGWRVVPLHPRAKNPRPRDWPNAASADPAVVARWWAEVPDGNVGVALGSGSQLVGIDIDSEEGERLLQEMAGEEGLGGPLQMTTGKGHRLLYSIPDAIEEDPHTTVVKGSDRKEALRFQGTGGQCVMPPSVHPGDPEKGIPPGRVYQWVEGHGPDAPAPPMPGWLIAVMCHPRDPYWAEQGARHAFTEGRDFNREADWLGDILAPAGFKPAGRGANGTLRFTRPGKDSGVSATVGHYRATDGTPALYVFSSSIPDLDAGRCYDKFGAFTRLFHGGDFSAATAEIVRRGFTTRGGRRRPPGRAPASGADPAAYTPASPPPAEPAAWGELVPIEQAAVPCPFPLDTLPPETAAWVGRLADALTVPPDYPGAFVIGTAAGLIGATAELEIDETWSERPVLYVAVVAPKSSGKSPAFKAVTQPVRAAQAERSHKGEKAVVYADDATVESLAPVLKENPRGLLIAKDELSGWVASFNQYKAKGSGADRQFWLTNWGGGALNVLRRNPDAPHIYVPIACVSVVGGIQPSVLAGIRAGADDGFSERILFAFPEPLPGRRYKFPGKLGGDGWQSLAGLLLRREMGDGACGKEPQAFRLSPEARTVFGDWTERIAAESNDPDRDQSLDGVRSKLKGTAARLALVTHLLWTARTKTGVPTELGREEMARGVSLAAYFLAHAARVFGSAAGSSRTEAAGRVVEWVRRKRLAGFTRAELWRNLRRSFADPDDLVPPLRLLVQLNHLRYAETPPPARGGRRPTPRYEVNPAVFGPG